MDAENTIEKLKDELKIAKQIVIGVRNDLKKAKGNVVLIRGQIAALQRLEREDRKALRAANAAKREQRAAERLAALEARLAALRAKQSSAKALKKAARKAGPVKLIPKENAA
jgi:hypothetical protein